MDTSSASTIGRRMRGGPRRLLIALAAIALVIASCGTNAGTSDPAASGGAAGAATQAPAISPAGR